VIGLQIIFHFMMACHATFFFSALSFYPGHGPDDSDAIPPFSYPLNGEQLSNSEAGNTKIESEEDWLPEPQLGGLPS
jgi:hypothetical protein